MIIKKLDTTTSINQQHWENLVRKKCGFTQPWLNLDRDLIMQYARGELIHAPEPLTEIYPPGILTNVTEKDVLCLASGGGQQSAVFALLGARVTVVDIAEGQLEGDKQAATHYGYKIMTVHADMRDIPELKDETFDLVYQAPSMAYIPDIREVYAEVSRLLKQGGLYRMEFTNPATEFVDCKDWDGKGYRISKSYAERKRHRQDGAVEFKHYLSEIFNELIVSGMSIKQVEDAHLYRDNPTDTVPGSWEHWLNYISGFAVIAEKSNPL